MIKSIISILSLLWILLAGTSHTGRQSLYKQPTRDDFRKEVDYWIAKNWNFIALAAILILLISFVLFMFWLCGVSAVESGNMRNFINGGVI